MTRSAAPSVVFCIAALCLQVLQPHRLAVRADECPRCSIEAVAFLPAVVLGPTRDGSSEGVMLGGLSDLVHLSTAASDRAESADESRFLAITDRGPNGSVQTRQGKRRTLLTPSFQPCLIEFSVGVPDQREPQTTAGCTPLVPAQVHRIAALKGRTGVPLTGLPNGIGADEPILNAAGTGPLSPDPNGIDPEGLVRLADGSLWISEEYRPSLLRVAADGRVLARHVPRGQALPGADMDVHETLPAEYGARRDNRGFEALAVSDDGTTLWALLQSPLDHPKPKAARRTGNVRLLAFDIASGKASGEYLYRLGDPTDTRYASHGAPPDDGKLCAMAAIDASSLLVIEQADDGLARLYRCDLDTATNTLAGRDGRAAPDRGAAIETIADVTAAGIVPVRKSLVADLTPLIPTMAAHVTAGAWRPDPSGRLPALKLEGLAILDERRIALVNDNDFDIDHRLDPTEPSRRSCVWIIRFREPLAIPSGR